MIAARLKALSALGAVVSAGFLAGCSQTTSHGMSVANLTDAITPSFMSRPFRSTPREKECLERAMFFESNRSSRDGMIAVGTVVMNRLKSGEHGSSICAVVGEKRQFAPGVMTRRMNSKAMPDVEEAAAAVLKGERSPKLKNAMHFHTAGLKFPYKNMHYVLVAGGNAFYEKRGRRWKPLPDDSMFAFGGATPAEKPAAPPTMVASAEPASDSAADAALPGVETAALAAPARQSAEPVEQAAPRKVRRRAPVANAAYEVASAEQPAEPARHVLAVPANAPVPTARAALAAKPARHAKPAVEMAADEPVEEPSAARFGRSEAEEPMLSFDTAQ